MVSSVAYKYARALAEVAGDIGQAQQVLTELHVFKDLLAEHPELFEILLNAALPFSARRQIWNGSHPLCRSDASRSISSSFCSGPGA